MQDEHKVLLGEIKGKLEIVIENQTSQRQEVNARLDAMDGRLRNVEIKAAKNGAIAGLVTGGIVAVGMEIIKAKIGSLFGGN